jgi:hypothetical protein
MGYPGQKASTHIYDGVVTRVDFEGKVYIVSVETRKPPLQVEREILYQAENT